MLPTATTNLCLHLALSSGRLSHLRSIARAFGTTTTIATNAPSLNAVVTTIEEPLSAPAVDGFGFPRFSIGQSLGPDNRYTIVRKLGWGAHSSCWMVRDELEKRYVALKAMTGSVTQLEEDGIVHERKALLKTSDTPSSHCLSLFDHFKTPGADEKVDGQHICLVTTLYGGDVGTLLKTFSKKPQGLDARGDIPVALSKRILLHLLRGLAHAHGHGIIHTDLKPENIFFTTHKDTAALDAWMDGDPARLHAELAVEPAISQPLPPPSLDEALRATYVLGDFSSAYVSAKPPSHQISPPALRAPEVLLGGNWDSSADIWSFGALVFELICRRPLFNYQCHPFGGDEIDNMIMYMGLYTEEEFTPDILSNLPLSGYFFYQGKRILQLVLEAENKEKLARDESDKRLRIMFATEPDPDPLERPISMYMGDMMAMQDIMGMKAVIKRCLRLDPSKRVTAQELLQDPWWRDVE